MAEWHHRQQALAEIATIAQGLARGDEHVVMFSDYEIANLMSLIWAIGYASVPDPSPLNVANTGDWVGQVFQKISVYSKQGMHPNVDAGELAERARRWKSL